MAPDFTVTDTEGVVHNLYADHLDQGQTVVIELFFVNCPPCRSLAPSVQNLYVEWGEGQADVEFIKLSTQGGDSNVDVAAFKAEFGTTFPGVGADGGAGPARLPYQDGSLGTFFGTPSFAVISPDGSVNYPLGFNSLAAAIEATGASGDTGGGGGDPDPDPEFTTVEITWSTQSQSTPDNVTFLLSSNEGGLAYNITDLTNGGNIFNYPSDMFPELQSPIITAVADGPALTESLKASDLFTTVKHILELNTFTSEAKLLAADVNSDDEIDPKDLLALQKVILELNDQFPGGTPSWKTLGSSQPLIINLNATVTHTFEFVKTGDTTF